MESRGTVVILAAGQGKRMQSRGPKVLQPLCGRPMLAYVLEQALSLPLDRIDRLRLGPGMLREASPLVADFRRYHAGVELKSDAVVDAVFPPGGSGSLR